MLLRSQSVSFPQAALSLDTGGSAGSVSSSVSANSGTDGGPGSVASDQNAGANAGATLLEKGIEAPKSEAPPKSDEQILDEELREVWRKSQEEPGDDDGDTGPLRDEHGRFKSSKPAVEGEEPPADDTDSGEENPPGNETDQSAEKGKETDPKEATVEMPNSWSKDDAETWAKLPPEAKAKVAQRETEVQQVLSRAGKEVAAYRHNKPIIDAVEPHKEYLLAVGKHLGEHPAKLVHQTLQFERMLRTSQSNEDRLGILFDIANEYGIDVSPIVGPDAAQYLQKLSPAMDPRVDDLTRQVQTLTHQLTAKQQAEQAEADRAMDSQIKAFASDTKKHPYYAEVKSLMATILQAPGADDSGKSLFQLMEEAYEQACFAHPKVRERILSDQRRAEEERRAAEARSKAASARTASSVNVRSGVPTPVKRTLDDTLAEAARKAYRGK